MALNNGKKIEIKAGLLYVLLAGMLSCGVWLGIMQNNIETLKENQKKMTKYVLKIAIELGVDVSNL